MFNGAYLKQLRLSKHYTLNRLSEATGYTPSFLSQIERGLKEPSLATLRKIAECFSIPPTAFFHECDMARPSGRYSNSVVQVVHKGMRQPISMQGIAATVEAIPFFTQNQDCAPAMQGVVCTLGAEQWCSETFMTHYKDQCIFIVKGCITFKTPESTLYADEGDCIYLKGDSLYNFRNVSDEECMLVIFSA